MKRILYVLFTIGFLVVVIATILILSSKNLVSVNKADTLGLAGEVEAINCNTIRGWAWDENIPDAPVKILFYVNSPKPDGTLVASLSANLNRPDIASLHSHDNGDHGFEITLPKSIKDGKSHKIYIYASQFYDSEKFIILPSSATSISCK